MSANPLPRSLSSSSVVLFLAISLFLLALLLFLKWTRKRPIVVEKEEAELAGMILQGSDEHQGRDSPQWDEAAPEERKGEEKKRKKRGKKKKRSDGMDDAGGDQGRPLPKAMVAVVEKHEEDCMYPFSSFSSVTQRRIKQKYDLLVKPNVDKGLTMAQVGQFANCLIEARKDLQHKSEVIQRKFTITKALLYKADRSSFGRLCQQICKLETEQKRLEEDALVYNRLQEQLKLSPAFKTMLEIGACMESSIKPDQQMKTMDPDFSDISFEELLAQEKKDSFWQRNGKLRSCVN